MLLFLLLLLAGTVSISGEVLNQKIFRFGEAPQFYNSPHCPSPIPPSSPICSSPALAHIAMTLDIPYLRGSLAAINSILRHSSCPESILFHFVSSSSIPFLSSTISSSFPSLPFHIHLFTPSLVSHLISSSLRSALDRPLNYARSYLPDLLPPCITRLVYLDSDIILFDDILSLAQTPIPPNKFLPIAAPQYCNANFSSYFTNFFWSNPLLSLTFHGLNPCYFNTGVMVMDLGRWRLGRFREKIEEWMDLQKKFRIYELGSLPPFLLVFAGRIAPVDSRWNVHGLGGDNLKGVCRDFNPGKISLLHWSGRGKPWVRIDQGRPCPVDALWAPYDLLVSKNW